MPWRLRKQVMLYLLGCAAIVLALIVAFTNFDKTNIELLAWIGFVGGIAIIINALPTNGNGH